MVDQKIVSKKMKNIINSILVLITIILITSCSKKTPPIPTTDQYGLPFPTHTGANTFGCLIDGVPFVVEGAYNSWTGNGIKGGFNLKDSIFNLYAYSKNPKYKFDIMMKLNKNFIGKGDANKYLIAGYTSLITNGSPIPGASGFYVANDSLPSYVTITHTDIDWSTTDARGHFISGTFDLTLALSDGSKVHITQGRFDCRI